MLMKRLACARLGGALLIATLTGMAPVQAAPPQAAAITRPSPDELLVRWQSPEAVDVLVADHADATVGAARLVSPRDADGQTAIAAHGPAPVYVLLRNVRTGEVVRVAERVLPLEAGSNFRDIGGYPAAGGKHVRWGLIYRSGATPLLTEADRARIGALHLRNMVDLRSNEERVMAPSRIDGVPYTAVGYSMGAIGVGGGGAFQMGDVYARLPLTMAPQLRQIFAKLLRDEGPLAYNCSAGQDRTGFATAVVLSALGTPYPVIVEDYHLSTQYRRPEFELPRIDSAQFPGNPVAQFFAQMQNDPRGMKPQPLKTADGQAYLDFAFAELGRKWGGVDGYLRQEIGLSAKDIASLRARYTQ